MKTITMILAACALCAGCASVEISSPGSLHPLAVGGGSHPGDRAVVVSDVGYHLFRSIPLGSGDLRWDEKKNDVAGGPVFFSNQARIDNCFAALQRVAERENCDLVDVSFTDPSNLNLEFVICGYDEIQASAILRPRTPGK